MLLGKWDKLIRDILSENKNLRFDDLSKALIKMGYKEYQPKSGGSHYTYRKEKCMPITLPKQQPMNKAYIELVSNAVKQYLETEG
ncbi:MAG: hypothetical protein BWY15_00551 [Firmicutes bacterium ADurb.Bin193]|nr:MAG: hypothetical protein BWY15_00551 [Firmicutes bacterium ADurb.Bin193]